MVNSTPRTTIVFLLSFIILLPSCTKKPTGSITVTTKSVTNITESSAKTGGAVTSTGYAIGDCGVCYGENHNPTLDDSFTRDQEGEGSFSSMLSNLKSGTTFYVRAYAKTSSGIEYGDERSFTTQGNSGGGGNSGEEYTINVLSNPTTAGTVTGSGTYSSGQNCTVTATANIGYKFTKWTENGTSVSTDTNYEFIVNNSRTLVANFSIKPQEYTITVEASPSAGGTVSGGGTYEIGDRCTLTATANNGYTFVGWTEDGSTVSSDMSYQFYVWEDRTLTAVFYQKPTWTNGVLPGLFSVSNIKKVHFSQGNLQYQASTDTWRFAENQYDVIGEANSNISSTDTGWIDLFGWGTSGYNHGAECYQPWSTSNYFWDYWAYGNESYNLYDQTGKADWGYNAISNGGNTTKTWRTLTSEEWEYVIITRLTPSGIRYAKATIDGIEGVILLPDDWDESYYMLNYTNDDDCGFYNRITTEDWSINLEAHGAVFLPAAGYRSGISIHSGGGEYWSTSIHSETIGNGDTRHTACYVSFASYQFEIIGSRIDTREQGKSVRLVCPR